MRVLLTTDTIGGVWTYTKELTEGLLQRSNAVALISLGRAQSADQTAWCASMKQLHPKHFQYTASSAPLEWMDANDSAYSGAEPLLLDLVNRFQPDLLHANQFCFGKLPVALPKLVAAHSDVLSWARACRPDGLEPSPWLERYMDLVQTGLLSANAVVAPTRWMLQALANNFALPDAAFAILNGRHIAPSAPEVTRHLQAVSVGRLWDAAKGLSLLAEVDSPFPIKVAGEAKHASHSAPSSLGSANLLGKLDDPALLHLFRSSSIYLTPSIYEPFGLAPLEAALCGCAVLARDIPSLREVWGSSALYFDDAPTLTSLLNDLASDRRLLEDTRRRSLARARHLSRTRMTELYLNLYRQLLEPMQALRTPSHAEVTSRVP